jgi:hypothetical protein
VKRCIDGVELGPLQPLPPEPPPSPLRVGDVLYGYCGGEFGDSYYDKRVEAIGTDWVVVRDAHGVIWTAENISPEWLCRYRTEEDYA